ncbi:ATP-binding protein [Streptomyces sp. XD-27]|uniref:ATP-binding protein n=1 Tax=Streptomyces sp. XD-27 TaxID=3062779 RepID=UPI0026F413BA|nr:ATP-binding protein [Streptomyces sp. XD-27]WKX68975.1 ATP-binding protein [Streptomyces sp. XD-27]
MAAVPLAPSGARAPVGVCGGVATASVAAAAGEVIRRGRKIAEQGRLHAEQEELLRSRLADQQRETFRLANELLPIVVKRLQGGMPAEEVLRDLRCASIVDPDYEAAHRRLLSSMVSIVDTEEALRDSAQRAFVNIARRVQALVHQQAQDLREMEDKHGNDKVVFADLLHIDHGTALVGRLADSIAVLGGARPGRQWVKEVPLFNVLRGAMSRIMEYRRVDLHSVADIAIIGATVEPLIHALAELLDNATRYSPPSTRVHLTATEVQNGVAIEIEDAGVGLTDEAAKRVAYALDLEGGGLDVDDLGEAPRLGLAVVGRLAAAYKFDISLRKSAYGGVRAVLVVPQDQTTATPVPGGMIARAAKLPPPKRRLRPGATPPPEPAPGAATEPEPHRGVNGLPQRRRRAPGFPARGRATSAAPAPRSPAPAAETSRRTPPAPGLWVADFMSGLNGTAPSDGSDRSKSDEPSGKDA